jgi:hypothetical protein
MRENELKSSWREMEKVNEDKWRSESANEREKDGWR